MTQISPRKVDLVLTPEGEKSGWNLDTAVPWPPTLGLSTVPSNFFHCVNQSSETLVANVSLWGTSLLSPTSMHWVCPLPLWSHMKSIVESCSLWLCPRVSANSWDRTCTLSFKQVIHDHGKGSEHAFCWEQGGKNLRAQPLGWLRRLSQESGKGLSEAGQRPDGSYNASLTSRPDSKQIRTKGDETGPSQPRSSCLAQLCAFSLGPWSSRPLLLVGGQRILRGKEQ